MQLSTSVLFISSILHISCLFPHFSDHFSHQIYVSNSNHLISCLFLTQYLAFSDFPQQISLVWYFTINTTLLNIPFSAISLTPLLRIGLLVSKIVSLPKPKPIGCPEKSAEKSRAELKNTTKTSPSLLFRCPQMRQKCPPLPPFIGKGRGHFLCLLWL